MCMYRIHIRMYTARTCTCMHTCTHTFIPWSARVRSFLRASSSACALALFFVASCAQSPFVCERQSVCVFVSCVFVYVCVECNRDHHSEFLRAGMHAPPASCQRELTLGTKSRQREKPQKASSMEAKQISQILVEFVQMCVFITAGPMIKLCAGGEGDSEGHVL